MKKLLQITQLIPIKPTVGNSISGVKPQPVVTIKPSPVVSIKPPLDR